MELFNLKSGEVVQLQKEPCSFRTITDLKDYHDGEVYEQGTSKVDLTGYESLESIVERCMRTSRGPNGQVMSALDLDMLRAEYSQQPLYEASSADDIDSAFETEDVSDAPTFDLADASRFSDAVDKLSTTANEPIVMNQANEPAVGNLPTSEEMPEKATV